MNSEDCTHTADTIKPINKAPYVLPRSKLRVVVGHGRHSVLEFSDAISCVDTTEGRLGSGVLQSLVGQSMADIRDQHPLRSN